MPRKIRIAYWTGLVSVAIGIVTAIMGFSMEVRIGHPMAWLVHSILVICGILAGATLLFVLLYPLSKKQ